MLTRDSASESASALTTPILLLDYLELPRNYSLNNLSHSQIILIHELDILETQLKTI